MNISSKYWALHCLFFSILLLTKLMIIIFIYYVYKDFSFNTKISYIQKVFWRSYKVQKTHFSFLIKNIFIKKKLRVFELQIFISINSLTYLCISKIQFTKNTKLYLKSTYLTFNVLKSVNVFNCLLQNYFFNKVLL